YLAHYVIYDVGVFAVIDTSAEIGPALRESDRAVGTDAHQFREIRVVDAEAVGAIGAAAHEHYPWTGCRVRDAEDARRPVPDGIKIHLSCRSVVERLTFWTERRADRGGV